MRYNQPYGTPEPPLGSYPRYVNGNPTTGTEGSIPPARAFDEDQIEIINVIANVGLTPNHTELDQLWQALQILIARKYITTPITKTVHGVGADFPDLQAAMRWLSEYTITQTGYVTFMVAPGKWVYTATVELNHANMDRVAIQGGALLGATPAPSNFQITGYHSSSDGTQHIIYLRSVYATELAFTGGVNGFLVNRSGCILRYLLITGSQTIAAGYSAGTNGPNQGNGIQLNADILLDGIAIWGFGATGLNCGIHAAKMITGLSFVASYNGWIGVNLRGGEFMAQFNSDVILVSNGVCGIDLWGGWGWFQRVHVRGHGPPNGNGAVQIADGGFLACNVGSVFSNNGHGVLIVGAASFLAQSNGSQGSYFDNNGSFGLYASGTCTVSVEYSSFIGNGTFAVIGNNGANIDAIGCPMNAPWTPAFNTYNTNAGAYMAH